MKKFAPLVIFLWIISGYVKAQSPLVIPYQAVARDASGNLLANTAVCVQFRIFNVSSGGTPIYEEHQPATTNKLGLFTLNIGAGTVDIGTDLGAIAWGTSNTYMEIAIDVTGTCNGSNTYLTMGRSQMLSVPYALYAGTAASGGTPQVNANWTASSGVAQILNKPTLATVATSGSYTDLSNQPSIPTSLPPSGTASGDLGGTYPSPSVQGLMTKALPSLASGFLKYNGTAWAFDNTGYLSSAVTSVGLAMPGIFSVSGSPVTTSGNLTAGLANQNANTIFAGPASGGATTPTFRALAIGDLPASGVTAGSYNNVTVNAAGQVTAGSNTTYLTASTGVSSLTAGTGISTSASTGAVTITNTGISTSGLLPIIANAGSLSSNGQSTDNFLGFVISASSAYSTSYEPWEPASGSFADWCTNGQVTNYWIQVKFPVATVANRVGLRGRSNGEVPITETVQGSNDGSSFTTLGSFSVNLAPGSGNQLLSFTNTTPYLYYRVTFPTSNEVSGNPGLCYLQFFNY